MLLFSVGTAVAQTPCPTAPSALPVEMCAGNRAVITAAMGIVPGTEMRLYNAQVGGTLVATSAGPNYLLTTHVLQSSATFWVASVGGVCESERTPVQVSVGNIVPGAPMLASANVARCSEGRVTFTVMNEVGMEARLYDRSSGGNILASSHLPMADLATPIFSTTTNYWVNLVYNGCPGPRVVVTATYTSLPPDSPNAANVARCGAGTVELTAFMGSRAGSEIRLYDTPGGGVPIATDRSHPYNFAIQASSNRTFWIASATDFCEGPRSAVSVFIRTLPSAPIASENTRCGTGRVTFSVSMGSVPGDELRLYAQDMGGMPISSSTSSSALLSTTTIATTTWFWASSWTESCESPRVRVAARVLNYELSSPSVLSAMIPRCQSGKVTFTVSTRVPTGETFRLYDAEFDGNLIQEVHGTYATLTTTDVNTSTRFWIASAQGLCESRRAEVWARVEPVLPAAPYILEPFVERCGPGVVRFSGAMLNPAGHEMRLYTTSTGGSPIAMSDAAPYILGTPYISGPTQYWIAAGNGVCESQRAAVLADVQVVMPSTPWVSSTQLSRCGNGMLSFTVKSGGVSGNEFRLYDATESLVNVQSDAVSVFYTPMLSGSTYFWIAAGNGACESQRIRVNTLVHEVPSAPAVADVERCGHGNVAFNAYFGSTAGNKILMYSQATGGSAHWQDFQAPYSFELALGSTTSYYFSAHNGYCESDRTTAVAHINPVPYAAPMIQSNAPVCSGHTLELSASLVAGANYAWMAPDGFRSSDQMISRVASSTNGGVYSVVATLGNCSSEVRTLNVTVFPSPSLALESTNVTSTNSRTGIIYAKATGGTPPYVYHLGTDARSSRVEVSFGSLSAGVHEVEVVDASGCSVKNSVAISPINCSLGVTYTQKNITCRGGADGMIDLLATGGNPPYFYEWSNGSNAQDLTNVTAGIYSVFVSDRDGCVRNISVKVSEPDQHLTIRLRATNPNCNGCSNGYLLADVMGGVPPYQFMIEGNGHNSGWQNSNFFGGLNAGTYTVKVLDFNGCWVSDHIMLQNPEVLACDQPPVLHIDHLSMRSAELSWPALQGALQYQISYKASTASNFANYFTTNSSYVLNDLQPLTEYQVRIRAYCVNGGVTEFSTITTFSTLGNSCPAPGLPQIYNVTQSSALIVWDAGTASTIQYDVQYKSLNAVEWTSMRANSPNAALINLASEQTYEVRIRRICDYGGISEFSSIVTFQTLESMDCFAPMNLLVSNVSGTGVMVSWSPGFGPSNYDVAYREQNTTNWSWVSTANASAALDGLLPNTVYEVQVRRNCGNGSYSMFSEQISFRTLPQCISPINVGVSSIRATDAIVGWSAINNVSAYEVNYRKSGDANWAFVNVNANSAGLTMLDAGSTYEVRVRSICTDQSVSGYSPVVIFQTTTEGVCGQPMQIRAITSSESATIDWENIANAGAYRVAYRTNVAGSSWTEREVQTNSVTITGLTRGTDYLAQVRTMCGANSSNWSGIILFSTIATRLQAEATLSFYPNPANDQVKVSSTEAISRLEMLDLTGKVVWSDVMNASDRVFEHTVSLSAHSPNVYFLKVYTESGAVVQNKLLIAR